MYATHRPFRTRRYYQLSGVLFQEVGRLNRSYAISMMGYYHEGEDMLVAYGFWWPIPSPSPRPQSPIPDLPDFGELPDMNVWDCP